MSGCTKGESRSLTGTVSTMRLFTRNKAKIGVPRSLGSLKTGNPSKITQYNKSERERERDLGDKKKERRGPTTVKDLTESINSGRRKGRFLISRTEERQKVEGGPGEPQVSQESVRIQTPRVTVDMDGLYLKGEGRIVLRFIDLQLR